MRYGMLILWLFVMAGSAQAEPGARGFREIARRWLGKPPARAAVQAPALERQVLRQAGALRRNLPACVGTKCLPPKPGTREKIPLKLSAEDLRFNAQNERLSQKWRAVSERDLALLRQYKPQILQQLNVSYPKAPVNYAALIPPQAKYIAVGEEHGFAPLRQAFEEMVFQYQALYPKRKIIVLTEFVFDRTLPLSEHTGKPVSLWGLRYRRISPDFRFLERFIKRGIAVIGLEDERFFRSHQRLVTPAFRQVESVYGMKVRNEHWRRIIADVRRREPHAVFFIYTGNMHVHYRAPFSLAAVSEQMYVVQLLARDLGTDWPFGSVMQTEPFARAEQGAYPIVLTWPDKGAYRILSGFDAGFIFPISSK